MIEEMNALAANYAALLSETRPEVIRDEKQNQTYIRRLQELTSKKSVTRAEEKLIALLALLIEDLKRSIVLLLTLLLSLSFGT